MQTKQINYIPELDSLRALAIIMTLICHFVPLAGFHLNVEDMNLGVDIFFTLSGFLITSILLKVKENKTISFRKKLWTFWIRRSLRLFPLYFIFLLFFYISANVFSLKLLWRNEYTAWFFTYTSNIYMWLHRGIDIYPFTHLWSLAVEEQFYILWPFLLLLMPLKWFMKILLVMILFSLGSALFFGDSFLFILPLGKFHILGIGAALAYLLNYKKDSGYIKFIIKNRQLLFSISLSFLLIILFFIDKHPSLFFYKQLFLMFSTVTLLITTIYGWTSFIKYFFKSTKVQYIGKISYGIYLLHLPIPIFIAIIQEKTNIHLNSISLFCIYFLSSFIVAALSYKFLESYFLKLKNKFI